MGTELSETASAETMNQASTMKQLPLSKAFRLIEPGPVVLVATAHQGKANIMTMSWHLVLDFTPQIGCVIGSWDYSYAVLAATKECVIAIPTVDLATNVVEIGNCSGQDVDKFKTFHLTAVPGKEVKAPLIAECLANIECRVVDVIDQYSLFILEGVRAWIDPDRKERRTIHANGDGTFVVDGRTLDLKQKMTKWASHTID
jgi:flavin reductase (DIM6/NTAB) family NADH-FMN oxidoreductase RutF